MKIPEKSVPKKSLKERRGRKGFLEASEKINAHFPVSLLASMQRLYDRGVAMRLPVKFTKSLILREGARMFVRKQNELIGKAEKGVLHAKPRPKGFSIFRR